MIEAVQVERLPCIAGVMLKTVSTIRRLDHAAAFKRGTIIELGRPVRNRTHESASRSRATRTTIRRGYHAQHSATLGLRVTGDVYP